MDLLTIVLMLLAGSPHAGWHGLVKSGADQTANLAGMGIVAALPAMAVILLLRLSHWIRAKSLD